MYLRVCVHVNNSSFFSSHTQRLSVFNCLLCFWLTGDSVHSDAESMEEEAEFNWEEYMEETGANAAPHTTFKHVSVHRTSSPWWSVKHSLSQVKYHTRNPLMTHPCQGRGRAELSEASFPSLSRSTTSAASANTVVCNYWGVWETTQREVVWWQKFQSWMK